MNFFGFGNEHDAVAELAHGARRADLPGGLRRLPLVRTPHHRRSPAASRAALRQAGLHRVCRGGRRPNRRGALARHHLDRAVAQGSWRRAGPVGHRQRLRRRASHLGTRAHRRPGIPAQGPRAPAAERVPSAPDRLPDPAARPDALARRQLRFYQVGADHQHVRHGRHQARQPGPVEAPLLGAHGRLDLFLRAKETTPGPRFYY